MNLTQLILGLSALTLGASMPLSRSGHRIVYAATHNQDNPLVTPLAAASTRTPYIGSVKAIQGDLKYRISLEGYVLVLTMLDVSDRGVPGINKIFVVHYVHEDNTETQIKGFTDRYPDAPPGAVATIKGSLEVAVKLLDFDNDQDRIAYQNQTAGALWNHPSNAYIRYRHLTNPKPCVVRKLVKKIGTSLPKFPEQAYLQLQLNEEYKIVNAGLFGMEQFKDTLKKKIIDTFGLRQRVELRL